MLNCLYYSSFLFFLGGVVEDGIFVTFLSDLFFSLFIDSLAYSPLCIDLFFNVLSLLTSTPFFIILFRSLLSPTLTLLE